MLMPMHQPAGHMPRHQATRSKAYGPLGKPSRTHTRGYKRERHRLRLVCDYRNCSYRLPPHHSQITRQVFLDGPRHGDHDYDEGGPKARRSGPRDSLYLNEVHGT